MNSEDDGDSDSDDASIFNKNRRNNSNSNRSNPYSVASEINAMSKAGERWTEDEVHRLKDMKERGMSCEEIANELHRTSKAIQVRLSELKHKKLK